MPVTNNFLPRGLVCALVFAGGCAHVPNQWQEDGPATREKLESPTAADVYARFKPAGHAPRSWPEQTVAQERGAVTHWPLYMEDPFVDKGAGREGADKYRLGWEDIVAGLYVYPRHTLNWMALPVSMVVQPPWTVMESDGVLSRQALGEDHDATELAGTSSE
jgi:hypothetical protein